MPRNGAGTMDIVGTDFEFQEVISEVEVNAKVADIEAELSNSVAADGQTTMSGALKMGSNKITGLAEGTADGDAANVAQVNAVAAAVEAARSSYRGAARPADAVAGQIWVRDVGGTPPIDELYLFDGAGDVLLGTVDLDADIFTPAGADFTALSSDVIPDADGARSIGSSTQAWDTIWADKIGDPSGPKSANTGSVVNGSPKAFASVDQTSGNAIRNAHNVSSVTDQGSGRTSLNYSNPFANALAQSFLGSSGGGYVSSGIDLFTVFPYFSPPTVSSSLGLSINGGRAPQDAATINLFVFGDLA